MIYCVLCGSHVPGHDMFQAWGSVVCRSHTIQEIMGSLTMEGSRPKPSENKPAPDIDIRG